MRFRLLGPVEMGTAECPTLLPGPRVIKVLAALLLDPDRVVSVDRVAERGLLCGRHPQVVGWLTDFASQHPLREALVGHLMVALYRAGRRADALSAYHGLRDQLRQDLGIDPAPPVGLLHERILRADPDLELVVAGLPAPSIIGANQAVPWSSPPRQL